MLKNKYSVFCGRILTICFLLASLGFTSVLHKCISDVEMCHTEFSADSLGGCCEWEANVSTEQQIARPCHTNTVFGEVSLPPAVVFDNGLSSILREDASIYKVDVPSLQEHQLISIYHGILQARTHWGTLEKYILHSTLLI